MEFVIVTCDDEQRPVFIDNQEQGLTGTRLSVPEGLHVFDLGTPVNYEPQFQEVLVENTTAPNPLVIAFAVAAAREAAPRRRAPKRRARKAKPARRARSTRRASARKPSTAPRARKTSRRKASRKKR